MSRRIANRIASLVNACLPVKVLVFCLLALGATASPVRAQSSQDPVYVFHTSLGDISVQLYPDVAPQTVANFLRYVNAGAYNASLIHRSVPGFVVQGGGYLFQSGQTQTIPAFPPVVNEFHLSNTRGTIAMAKLGNDPNSATSQWFFNESDSNASNLDKQNGGFTVFGKITDQTSLAVMDQIAAVPVFNLGSPFDQIPLVNYQSGMSVQASNLVTLSSIIPVGHTHVLWTNTDGTVSLWNYDALAGTYGYLNYGPFAGWTARAIADGGTDGKTRVLWTRADGTASLWSLDNASGLYVHHEFGPYTGWTAVSISVGADNTTHVLWTSASGQLSLWNYDAAAGAYSFTNYGPFPGWSATSLADGGTDGKTRVLWTRADGTASLWSLSNTSGVYTNHEFGPFAGWTAGALSVGLDNATHVLWTNTSGQLSLWNYDAVAGTFSFTNYGPFAGWSAKSLADGLDGKTRVLWGRTDGTASLWSLDNTSGLYVHHEFGPYSGWTAMMVSAGP